MIACLEAPNCKSFDTWGFTDKHTWLKPPAYPLPFDTKYAKKFAYNAMINTLHNWPRDHVAVVERNRQLKEREEYLASLPQEVAEMPEEINPVFEETPEELQLAIAAAEAHQDEIRELREQAIQDAKDEYLAELEFLQK